MKHIRSYLAAALLLLAVLVFCGRLGLFDTSAGQPAGSLVPWPVYDTVFSNWRVMLHSNDVDTTDGSFSNFQRHSPDSQVQFLDIDPEDWYSDSVNAACAYGFMVGIGNDKFAPGANLTIAEALAIADRLHNLYYGGSGAFSQGTPWYQVYVDYAVRYGIVQAGAYDPTAEATRAQFAVILDDAFPADALPAINHVSAIPDLSDEDACFDSVLRLYNAGILTGTDDMGTFRPDEHITRAEVAAMVTRFADEDLRIRFRLDVLHYASVDDALYNPLMGNAWWAEDLCTSTQPVSLVYANITWAELEPEEGQYDFEAFEEACHFEHWRSQGVHMILRFVMDIPSDTAHKDLPDWLTAQVSGNSYNIDYGQGWCPDYTDPQLLAAHRRTIAALGDRYDGDPFISFVELGSLGHWGEWHVHRDAGEMPEEAVRDQYVQDYLDAFRETKLLMRRPFRIAAKSGLGLYNDAAGIESSTHQWLDWIANGGDYEGVPNQLSPMPDAWISAPIGGELTPERAAEDLLQNDDTLLAMFRQSHTSWIGPNSFAVVTAPALQPALDKLQGSIGYRLLVTTCILTDRNVFLTFGNDGIAPFYYPWPVRLRLVEADGTVAYIDIDIDLRDILPDSEITFKVPLPEGREWEQISIAVIDPMTAQPAVHLAMDIETDGLWHILCNRK